MSATLTTRASLPRSHAPDAITRCACGNDEMLIAREGGETARIECTACGASARVGLSDGFARLLHRLPGFHLTRARQAASTARPRRDLYALFGLTPPA